MPVAFNPKVTDAGRAAAIAAAGSGLQLAITHVALGTGNYDSSSTGAAQTALVALKEAVVISAGAVTPGGAFTVTVQFPEWAGSPSLYNAEEIGFYAGNPAAGGVLFAVFSSPGVLIQQRNASSQYLATFTLTLTNVPAGSVTVQVDTSAAATLALLTAHLAASNPHPQYIKRSGDVALTANFATTGLIEAGSFISDSDATTPQGLIRKSQMDAKVFGSTCAAGPVSNGTWFTNNTGHPIEVMVVANIGVANYGWGNIFAQTSDVNFGEVIGISNDARSCGSFTMTVPPGKQWQVSWSGYVNAVYTFILS